MYRAFFGFDENPFTITPDPRFLFLSQRHREALAHLLYGMSEGGGFVQLTGEVGTGKTTLCRYLLEQAPEGVDVALILNPRQTAAELVASVCEELHILVPSETRSLKRLIDLLNQHLLKNHAEGRRTVLIIDEAQNLSSEALEQVRLLTNLETPTQKLLQILVIGQPELKSLLARPELRQVAQRITARYHLSPLRAEETAAYIQHRLEVAGGKRQLLDKGALGMVHRLSGGIPRLINVICDRALLGAYGRQRASIDKRLVLKAHAEVTGVPVLARRQRLRYLATAAVLLILLAAGWRFIAHPLKDGWAPSSGIDKEAPPEPAAAGPVVEGPPALPPGEAAVAGTPGEGGSGSAPEEMPDPEQGGRPGDLAALFKGDPETTDAEAAFTRLFRLWNLSYRELPGLGACERAEAAGLRCLRDRGDWAVLEGLNRPVVLELTEDGQAAGRRYYVTLSGLSASEATLELAGGPLTVPRTEVEAHWPGSFVLVWRAPQLGGRILAAGARGKDVLWLRERLDRLERTPAHREAGTLRPLFDQALRERVMAFQRSRGLKVDGKVGEQTLLHLNTALGDASTPLLVRERE